MSKLDTLEALYFVLSEKVYPIKPSLIRNDSQCGKLVREYVDTVWDIAYENRNVTFGALTRFERDIDSAYYRVEPLLHRSVDTLRKYTAELWEDGKFDDALRFEIVRN